MDGESIRLRFDSLVAQRKTLDNTFQLIEKFIVPYRGEFFKPETSMLEVEWRRRQIYDSTAPVACDTLASKLHTGITNPFLPWFELKFRNDDLNRDQAAKEWLEDVQNRMWQAIQESDFDREIAEIYLDTASFATAILFREELSEEEWQGITFSAKPVKDTYFEMGADDNLLRTYSRLQYTKIQLKDKFPDYDFEDISDEVDDDNVDERHDVIFCIYKRNNVKTQNATGTVAPKARQYGWKYILHASAEELDEGGYYEMPASVVRFKKVSGSQWGHGPAFVCLSDVLQLNEVVSQTSEARAKEIDPPMKTTERGVIGDLDLNPGTLTTVTDMDELDRLLPFNPFVMSDVEIERLQNSIRSVFFIDRLELKESPAMTAYETAVRKQLMMENFAPTLGRFKADLLDPTIEGIYAMMGRAGQLPEAPEGLEFSELDIVYTGQIPRMQMNDKAQGISRWIAEIANLTPVIPDLVDVVDTDKVGRELGYDLGVSADLMRPKEEVASIRQQRAEAQQQMMQLEALKQAGEAGKAVGEGQAAMEGTETVQ